MKKYIAKQVNPEYQQSPLMWEDNWEGTWLEELCVFGNKDYKDHLTSEAKDIIKYLDEACECYVEIQENSMYKIFDTIEEIIAHYFEGKGSVSEWEKVFKMYIEEGFDLQPDIMCKALTVYSGKSYECRRISGCVQGDWNILYYPSDEWNDKQIEQIEVEYFNTGDEWLISVEPIDENTPPEQMQDTVSYYTHEWNTERRKEELAEAIGCNTDDLIMYEFMEVKVAAYERI